jgi:hypothetical protein
MYSALGLLDVITWFLYSESSIPSKRRVMPRLRSELCAD